MRDRYRRRAILVIALQTCVWTLSAVLALLIWRRGNAIWSWGSTLIAAVMIVVLVGLIRGARRAWVAAILVEGLTITQGVVGVAVYLHRDVFTHNAVDPATAFGVAAPVVVLSILIPALALMWLLRSPSFRQVGPIPAA
jgi:hypothetical protein